MRTIIIFIFCVLLAGTMKAQNWGDDTSTVKNFLWEENGEPTGQDEYEIWYAWENGYQETYLFDDNGLTEVQLFEEFDDAVKEYTDQRDLLMLEHEIIESYDEYLFDYTYKEDAITIYVDGLKKNLITIIKKIF